jgi:hypothetical protein
MYMIWHMRYRHDPVNNWVREELETLVPEVVTEEPMGLKSEAHQTTINPTPQ